MLASFPVDARCGELGVLVGEKRVKNRRRLGLVFAPSLFSNYWHSFFSLLQMNCFLIIPMACFALWGIVMARVAFFGILPISQRRAWVASKTMASQYTIYRPSRAT